MLFVAWVYKGNMLVNLMDLTRSEMLCSLVSPLQVNYFLPQSQHAFCEPFLIENDWELMCLMQHSVWLNYNNTRNIEDHRLELQTGN